MPRSQTTSPAAPQPSGDSARVPTIDLLRGMAILLVILYHLDNQIILQGGWGLVRGADGIAHLAAGGKLLRFLLLPFHMGRVGVNLFFVISGLCIHLRFARAQAANPAAPFSLRTFFLRRFFRIYPVYWVALGLGAFVAPLVYKAAFPDNPPGEGWPTLGNVAAHAVMLHSFSKTYMMGIITALWSIATEEQFYLLYPLVFVVIGRRLPIKTIVLALLALTVAWRLTLILSNPPPQTFADGPFLVWVFGFSLPRYFEWSLGALLAWMIATGRTVQDVLSFVPGRLGALLRARPALLIPIGIATILLGGASLLRVRIKWMVEDPLYSTGWFLIMLPLLLRRAGAQAVAAATPVRAAQAWVATRLQNLGRRSFSVYLIHEMVLFTTAGLMRRFDLPPAGAALLGCFLIWATCYPFYRYIEAPFELRSKMVGKVRSPLPATLSA
jgi:peptidoglycan/LPS O-acetylase OafA/YrhL